MFGSCSICAAPAEVQSAINRGLAARVKLRILAQESGLSKSAIHRHSQKCIARQTLNTFKSARFNANTGRIFVRWSDDPCAPPEYRGRTFPSSREMTADDVLIVVEYEPPILDEHGRYFHPGNIYETALRENEQFDALLEKAENATPLP
jgi:hypothetical protein